MKPWWDNNGNFRKGSEDFSDEYYEIEREKEITEEQIRKYVLMTSVSMPVFDKGNNASTLHGVAGIDVPIEEFKRLLRPYLVSAF
jgi:voltage-dependent calcium channel alpha-2/delta-3